MEGLEVKRLLAAMVMSILILASCSNNDESLNSSEVEIISSELLSEACVAEASEMSFVILSGLTDSQLGSILAPESIPNFSLIDSLMTGASVAVSGAGGMTSPKGTITVDFKTGIADRNGVVRKGKITINYSGRRWAVGSTRTITFSGYSRNNVKIADATNYTITLKDSTENTRKFHHLLKDCILTFPDLTTFKRKAEFTDSINLVSKTTTLFKGDTINNGGTTRYGVSFVMSITAPVIYKPQCIGAKMYLPNEGEKSITVESTTYTVIYGSTLTCSRTVNVTAGGKYATITINSDGN